MERSSAPGVRNRATNQANRLISSGSGMVLDPVSASESSGSSLGRDICLPRMPRSVSRRCGDAVLWVLPVSSWRPPRSVGREDGTPPVSANRDRGAVRRFAGRCGRGVRCPGSPGGTATPARMGRVAACGTGRPRTRRALTPSPGPVESCCRCRVCPSTSQGRRGMRGSQRRRLGPPSSWSGGEVTLRCAGAGSLTPRRYAPWAPVVTDQLDFGQAHAGTCGHDRQTAATRCADVRSPR